MLNRLAHVGIGAATGWFARRHPRAAGIIALTFLTYQVVETWRKHQSNPQTADKAYPEIREFGYGLAIGLAAEAADDIVDDHSHLRWRLHRYRVWVRLIRKAIRPTKSASNQVK